MEKRMKKSVSNYGFFILFLCCIEKRMENWEKLINIVRVVCK